MYINRWKEIKILQKLNKMSDKRAKEIYGGSIGVWNAAIAFGIIGNTIVSIIQLITSVIVGIKAGDKQLSSFNPNFTRSSMKFRISKYPSKSNVFM